MSSKAHKKGYVGEHSVWQFFKKRGFFRAYLLKSQGVKDKGDVGGIDDVCIEIKNAAIYDFPGWLREMERERIEARAGTGAVVVKPKGVGITRVEEWWTVVPLGMYVDLLIRAGYGPHKSDLDPGSGDW